MQPRQINADDIGGYVTVTSTGAKSAVSGTLEEVRHSADAGNRGVRTHLRIATVAGDVEIEAGRLGRGDPFTIEVEAPA